MDILETLKEGTKVVLTKTTIINDQSSAFKPGEKRSGTLSRDLRIGKPLYFKEWNDSHVTSEVESGEVTSDTIKLQTRTSTYEVRIVNDGKDDEFRRWINY